MRKLLLASLVSTLLAVPAFANPIGVFSTGVADDGTPLSVGDVDPHYRITTAADPIPQSYGEPAEEPLAGALIDANLPAYLSQLPGAWVANGPLSNWISPSPSTTGATALFTYETRFDLTGLNPASAVIAGSWAEDDYAWMYLNGNLVAELPFGWMFQQLYGLQVAPNAPQYTANHDFVITSGFVPGENVLQLIVWNAGGGPTGVRVEIASATADPDIKTVLIDVRPGTADNPVNPESKGKIPVAVLSTGDFDAVAQVDVATLSFGATGDEPSLAFCNTAGEDVNADGLTDLVCHFSTPTSGFTAGCATANLKGKTLAGTPIVGQDAVQIVP